MILLIRTDDEQRVGLVDAVRCQAGEELTEGLVISLQLGGIQRFAGAECGR